MSTETAAGERKDDGEETMAPPVGGRPFRLGQRAEKPQEEPRVPDPYMTVGRYVRIGRATRVGEQAGVVGLRRRGGIESKPVSEPGRNQGAAQAVLERLAHAQVGGHAQRGDELRASNLLVALRRFG